MYREWAEIFFSNQSIQNDKIIKVKTKYILIKNIGFLVMSFNCQICYITDIDSWYKQITILNCHCNINTAS